MRRAQTIYSTFSISIQPKIAPFWPRPPSTPPSASDPIQPKRILPWPIFCFDAVANTIARWKNSQSHGQVCRIARLSSFSPATSLGAVTIGLRLSEIFPKRSPSIREILTPTICWLIRTCCNGDFPKRCRPTSVSWMQVSRRRSFKSVGHRHFSMEPGIQNHCAKPWPARQTWT